LNRAILLFYELLYCKSTLFLIKCKKILFLQRNDTKNTNHFFANCSDSAGCATFSRFRCRTFGSIYIVASLSLVSFLLAIVSIFSYKKRVRQILLNNINIFINALLTGLLIYWLLNLSGGISFPEKGIELAFPLISLFCLFMANIYIRKDEKLVKSVDRIR
jgi:hypothetical protein